MEAERQKTIATEQTKAAELSSAEAKKQQSIAQKNAFEAQKQERIALKNLQNAQKQQALAEKNQKEAEKQSRVALSRRAASNALAHLDDSLNYALNTSLQANAAAKTFEAKASLFTALQCSPHLTAFLGRHDSSVNSLAFSPKENLLLSAGDDGNLWAWNLVNNQKQNLPVAIESGKTIMNIAFSGDGKKVALSLIDKNENLAESEKSAEIILLDTKNWSIIGEPIKPQEVAFSLALNSDGSQLATGNFGAKTTLWKIEDKQFSRIAVLRTKNVSGLSSVSEVEFSKDDKKIASLVIGLRFEGADEHGPDNANVVLTWDIENKNLSCDPLKTTGAMLQKIIFLDNKALIIGTSKGNLILQDTSVKNSVEQLNREETKNGNQTSILVISFNKETNQLTTVTKGKELTQWSLSDKKPIKSKFLKGLADDFVAVSFDKNGNIFASGLQNGQINLWDVSGQALLGRKIPKKSVEVKSLNFHPIQNLLVAAGSGSIVLWDVDQEKATDVELKLPFEDAFFAPYAFSKVIFGKDGKRLISGSQFGITVLWDWKDGSLRPTNAYSISGAPGVTRNLSFSGDLSIFAANKFLQPVTLWNGANGKFIGSIPVDNRAFDLHEGGVALSPNGKILAAVDGGGNFSLWNVSEPQKPVKIETPAANDVLSLTFNKAGDLLATANGSGVITMWSMNSYRPVFSLRSPTAVYSLSSNSTNEVLVSGDDKGVITLWDIEAQQALGEFFDDKNRRITSLAFNASDTILASGQGDEIILWDTSLESWEKRAKRIANFDK